MKYLKHLLCMVLIAFPFWFLVQLASESKGGGVDLQGILWGHIKDSYEWHVTNIGDKPVIINLPVIVKTSDGLVHWLGRRFCRRTNRERSTCRVSSL